MANGTVLDYSIEKLVTVAIGALRCQRLVHLKSTGNPEYCLLVFRMHGLYVI